MNRDMVPKVGRGRACRSGLAHEIVSFLLLVLILQPEIRADTIYVWSGDTTIRKFTSDGTSSVLASNLNGGNGPVGLAVDSAGNLYSGCPANSQIVKYSTNGTSSLVGNSVDSVSGLAFDGVGNLIATSPNYLEIGRLYFVPGFGYYVPWGPNSYSQEHLNWPTSVAFDKAGFIYVANGVSEVLPYGYNPYTNSIVKFTPDFTFVSDFAKTLNKPWGLAFDQSGNLFVSNSGNDRLYKFSHDGTKTLFAFANGLSSPRGVAFDSSGILYVVNAGNGTIQTFTSGGVPSVFASGLTGPVSVAIFPGLGLWRNPAMLYKPTKLPSGEIQINFNYAVGSSFNLLATSNLLNITTNWTDLGSVEEIWAGQFRFTDLQATNSPEKFYRARLN